MSMTIHTNVPATRTHGIYNRNNSYMNEALTRVATGMKINSAKDGASVYAISERMRGQIRANDQANQNTQNDSALLKTAQGGISNTISILNTLRERAINSANDSNLNTNRSDIATEVQQLVMQIDDNANKVKFNGRTLLNGAVDNTVGKLGSVSSGATGATEIENPTNSSTHAVYGLTSLYQWSSGSVAAAASDTKLVDLVKANATGAGDTLFQVGDKITFTWKENGASISKSLDVTNSLKVTNLNELLTTSGGLTTLWKTANTTLSSTGGADDYEKTVLDAQGEKFTTSAAGLYAVGDPNKAITDFTVSVTYNTESGRVNRTEAQEALQLRGMQQGYGEKLGSNSVVSSKWFNGATDAGIQATNTTAFQDWTVTGGSTKVFTSDVTSVKFEVTGSAGNKTVTLDAGQSLEDLNKALADIGIQASIVGKGETVTYNGATVTRSSGGNDSPLKAASAGLFFVGADGVDIGSVKVTAQKTGDTPISSAAKGLSTNGASGDTLTVVQSRQTGTPESTPTAALTFFVGGEPNFGINVSINKMTSNELLGMSADGFATKFLSKEGAQSAITTIDNALNKALNEQTKLGALEARLGYTSDNLTTMNENLEASDSVMRDSDIAKEMTNYMKYSVLSQAAQYMLAQSGQNAFSVLNLLQQ